MTTMQHERPGTALTLATLIATGAVLPPAPIEDQHPTTTQVQGPETPAHAEQHSEAAANDPNIISSVTNPDGSVDNTRLISVPVDRPWARKYSADPAAIKTPESQEMSPFVTSLGKLAANGERVKSVTAQGFASDEAETNAPKTTIEAAGLGEANPENVELADTRAHAVGPAAEAATKAVTGQEIPVQYLPGNEVIDAQFAQREANLAAQLHTTPLKLAKEYNRQPEQLPEHVKDQLDRWQQDRRVDLTVVSTKNDDGVRPNQAKYGQPVGGDGHRIGEIPEGHQEPTVWTDVTAPEQAYVEAFVKPGRDGGHLPAKPNGTPLGTYQAIKQIQPREFNMGKNSNAKPVSGKPRGRTSRSHGGNRGYNR
jgi:hypothetical protein